MAAQLMASQEGLSSVSEYYQNNQVFLFFKKQLLQFPFEKSFRTVFLIKDKR
jgi:hypothetical protein